MVLALVAVAAVSCSPGVAGKGRLDGARIEVLGVWSGAEYDGIAAVLRGFERATGATVLYTSAGHGVAAALDARIAEGSAPDVAFVPQPGLLQRYAADGRLVALDGVAGDLVRRNYDRVWRDLGSAGGHLYGVWLKAADKSLVWYDVGVFERLGAVPPADLDGLARLASAVEAAGLAPFSVAGAAGWALTDWFENLYLRTAGPDAYDRLTRHELPWTDPSVTRVLGLMAALLAPGRLAAGVDGSLGTDFPSSVQRLAAKPPSAAMTVEGDFVAGELRGAGAEVGVDTDAFPFPAAAGSRPAAAAAVVGAGDAAVLLRPSAAGAAFLRWVATPEAAALWAARGGFVSPNRNLDLAVYPDELSRTFARSVLEAGDSFRFDLSDLAPAAFGGKEGQGMRAALQDFLRTRDVDATAARLEAGATAAYNP
ncbi:MAG TPA: ABC transporter substrate-binding protein [Acidimicrobiales bacterium]|nr:ABC transporter substrate-binding protein [Acidimicrobiales bacterium]